MYPRWRRLREMKLCFAKLNFVQAPPPGTNICITFTTGTIFAKAFRLHVYKMLRKTIPKIVPSGSACARYYKMFKCAWSPTINYSSIPSVLTEHRKTIHVDCFGYKHAHSHRKNIVCACLRNTVENDGSASLTKHCK